MPRRGIECASGLSLTSFPHLPTRQSIDCSPPLDLPLHSVSRSARRVERRSRLRAKTDDQRLYSVVSRHATVGL